MPSTTPSVTAPPAAEQAAPTHPRSEHRGDIQGLRAVAVLLVMAYHAGLPGISGGFVGVDVFFVISGFLITGLIVREIERTGRLRFGRFYARRIRRLLPATSVVLVVTAALTVLVLPVTRWASTAYDIVASALYVINWRLAATSVDYLASEQAASPVQHFWSLAVEEQFYVVWPLMIALCLLLRRRFEWPLRRTLAVGLTAVALPTLAWSVWYTAVSPAQAYFVSTTRLWELAIGAILVLVIDRAARLPRPVAWVLGAVGLVGIVVSTLWLTVQTPFPGFAALLPVLSTAAVLAAGAATPTTGAGWVLTWRPLRQIGDLSYSLYLWHWPAVVFGTALLADDDGQLWWGVGALLVAASAIPAWLTYTVVERPIHESPGFLRRRAVVATLVICTTLPLIAAGAIHGVLMQRSAAAPSGEQATGALALGDDPSRSPAGAVPERLGPTKPDVTVAADDNAAIYEDGCHLTARDDEPVFCTYGKKSGTIRVALIGDSHAAQWQPALAELADQRGWRLDTYTKAACGFFDLDVATSTEPPTPYKTCSTWNGRVVETVIDKEYDLVVTSGSNNYLIEQDGQWISDEDAEDVLARGYARQWNRLSQEGIPVVAIANTPWMSDDVPDCLARHPEEPGECASPRGPALKKGGDRQAAAVDLADDTTLIDLNAWVCPRDICSPVIGDVIVWRDAHHLTATYARSLTPILARELDRVGAPR